MTGDRYRELRFGPPDVSRLTQSEIDEGWHFCIEWDFMLIGPGMPEYDITCRKE